MTMGNILRERDQQYIAHRDEKTQTWRILDTWHDDLKLINPDDDIEDESAAVTIITEGGFHSLVREAARLGVLENANLSADVEEYEAIIQEKNNEIARLQTQTNTIEPIVREPRSEAFDLKEKAMESILKLVSISDLAGLSKDETI